MTKHPVLNVLIVVVIIGVALAAIFGAVSYFSNRDNSKAPAAKTAAPFCVNRGNPSDTDPNTGEPRSYTVGETMKWNGRTYVCEANPNDGKALFIVTETKAAPEGTKTAPESENGDEGNITTPATCTTGEKLANLNVPAMTGKGVVPTWQVAWSPYDTQRTGNGDTENYDLHSGLWYLSVGTVYGQTGVHVIYVDCNLGDGAIVTADFTSAEVHQTVEGWVFNPANMMADAKALAAYKANEKKMDSLTVYFWIATGDNTATPGIPGLVESK